MPSYINLAALVEMATLLEDDLPGRSFYRNNTRLIDKLALGLIKNDTQSLIQNLHNFKGRCRHMCTDHLAELYDKYEAEAKNESLKSNDPDLPTLVIEFERVKITFLAYRA